MDSSLQLDEFGIIHDQTSKSSDSMHHTESNTNLTDNDISEHIFPESSASHSRSLTLNIDSEGVTQTSSGKGSSSHSSSHQSQKNLPPAEIQSLTEFEEIEHLIEENTVHDSDDGLPELPIDLEPRVLSGCVSRGSSVHSKLNEGANDVSPPESCSTNTNPGDEQQQKQPSTNPGPAQDTGYISEGPNSTAISSFPPPESRSRSPEPNRDDFEELEESATPHFDQGSNNESPSEEVLENSYLSQSGGSNGEDVGQQAEITGGSFSIPTNRFAVGDTHQPESLVATFGTTEDFEVLLQQQLDSTPTDDERGPSPPNPSALGGSGDHALQQLRETRTYPPSGGDKSHKLITPRSIKSNLKLSSSLGTTARPAASGRSEKPARSPAANRVKRANNGTRVTRVASYRDSSDDISVVSDASRTELRSKLKEEARIRKRDKEFVRELKSNYDALLMKYAEAENTIDHLRLGAKINLYANLPESAAGHDRDNDHDNDDRSSESTSQVVPSVSESVPSRAQSVDTLVESSLQLPAAASKEFLKVALQLQAKDVKDKIDSFNVLLQETELSPSEQEHVMGGIVEGMRELEADYLRAVDQHAEDQRRASIATDGAISATQEFDPDRSMEADILSLHDKVEELQQQIKADPVEGSFQSPYKDKITSADSSMHRDFITTPPPDSPDSDVESQFQQLMERYQPPTPKDSRNDSYFPDSNPSFSDAQHDRSHSNPVIPDHYLEPVSQSTTRPETSSEIGNIPGPNSSSVLESSASPFSRPQPSRLPRPVGSNKQRGRKERSPKPRKTIPVATGTDSGFVGSESSRQSAPKLQSTKIKLVSVSPTTSPKVQKTPSSIPDSRSVASVTSSSIGFSPRFTPRMQSRSSHQDGFPLDARIVPSYTRDDDSVDDVSTTSTVREMLRPRSASASSSSSQTTAVKVAVRKDSKAGASLKSAGSVSRSVASSPRDSTLDLIRGEISKLRDEMKANKAPNPTQPVLTSTPRRPQAANVHSKASPLEGDMLRSIRDDIKGETQRYSSMSWYYWTPHYPADVAGFPPSNEELSESSGYSSNFRHSNPATRREGFHNDDANDAESSPSRSSRRVKRIRRYMALKEDLNKGRQSKKLDLDAESCSATSASPSTRRRSTTEAFPKYSKPRRSRSLDRRRSDRIRDDSGSETRGDPSSRHSRSQERSGPWSKGFWAYVPPVQAELQPQRIMARTYPCISPSPTVIVDPSPYISVPLHSSPVIAPPSNIVMAPPRVMAAGRVYSKAAPHEARSYWAPSKPKASVFIAPKSHSRGRVRKASVYVVDSDDDELTTRRNRLSKSRDTTPLVVTLLDDSLERAEKSSHSLRSQSRNMYRSTRDALYRAQLLAETL